MSRRVKGEGSVYQRKDGRWFYSVDLGWHNGKRDRRTVSAATLKALRPEPRARLQLPCGPAPEAPGRLR